MLFFIDYDLRKQRNYQPLYDELKRFNAVKVLESCWCLDHGKTTAVGLRDHFGQFIDPDDGLCVTQVTDWATRGTLANPKQLKSAA